MPATTILKSIFGITWKIGGFMCSPMERWLYPDAKLQYDIIVHRRSIAYHEGTGIPNLSVYLDVYNRTLYSKINIGPAVFTIKGEGNNLLVKLNSDGNNVAYNNHHASEFIAVHFRANLSGSELKKIKEYYNLQLNNNCQGQLQCSVTLPIECDNSNRKIYKDVEFNSVEIHGIKL